MRFSKTGWAAAAAVVIVAMISQGALAQRDTGRGRGGRGGGPGGPGGGGPSSVRLAGMKEVQAALKLTDDQKDKIGKLNDQMRDDARKAMDDGNGREKMKELNDSASAKLNEILDVGQQKRMMGILIQVAGANATADPGVAKELNLTDDQKKKLDEARDANGKAMREAFAGARDQTGGREEMRTKMEKMRDDANKKIMEVLTSEQQSKLESLKGEKVDIDMAQLRGGQGGPAGDRRTGGRGGRGNRNSDSKGEEKSNN